MKCAVFLLVCLPLVFSAPEKRVFFDTLLGAFSGDQLKQDLQVMVDTLGSDPTEQACEAECHKLISTTSVLQHICPLMCHSFQELLHKFNIAPPATTVASS